MEIRMKKDYSQIAFTAILLHSPLSFSIDVMIGR